MDLDAGRRALGDLLRADLADQLRQPIKLLTVRTVAVVLVRLSSALGAKVPSAGFVLKQVNHVLTGADIAWQAEIGPGLQLFHPTGVVIGPYVRIGANCHIQQGVTMGGYGGESAEPADFPVIGSDVAIGAGAKIIGPVKVGDRVKIGANAVVLQDVPDQATAVGVPARVVRRQRVD